MKSLSNIFCDLFSFESKFDFKDSEFDFCIKGSILFFKYFFSNSNKFFIFSKFDFIFV